MPQATADLTALGAVIRERRRELNVTQAEIAARTGWVQERISLLENGKYGLPSLPALSILAGALEKPLADLLQALGFHSSDTSDGISPEAERALHVTLQWLLEIDASTLEDAMQLASDRIAEAMGAEKVDVFLFDHSIASLVALGTSNTEMGRRQHQLGLQRLPAADRGRSVQVYETGEPFWSPDVSDDQEVSRGVREQLGVRSMLVVPLLIGDVRRGVLSAQSSLPARFGAAEREFFASVARWVGLVARRAELSDEIRASTAEDARRMAADDLIAALAHDLGNQLTPLKGRLDLVRRLLARSGMTPELEHIDAASRSAESIDAMIARLLDATRLEEGLFSLSTENVNLVAIVEDVAADLRHTWQNIVVRPTDRLDVAGDPVRLREILTNLLTNAGQHSPDGAPIIVTAISEEREDGPWAIVTVSDEGPGIPADRAPRLFERFARGTRSGGLGLGLYLSRRLAEAHGGTLTLDPPTGGGATFRLAIPCIGDCNDPD